MPLSGYKTYIIAIALGLLTIAKSLGYVDSATYANLAALLGSSGLVALRMAVSDNGVKSLGSTSGSQFK